MRTLKEDATKKAQEASAADIAAEEAVAELAAYAEKPLAPEVFRPDAIATAVAEESSAPASPEAMVAEIHMNVQQRASVREADTMRGAIRQNVEARGLQLSQQEVKESAATEETKDPRELILQNIEQRAMNAGNASTLTVDTNALRQDIIARVSNRAEAVNSVAKEETKEDEEVPLSLGERIKARTEARAASFRPASPHISYGVEMDFWSEMMRNALSDRSDNIDLRAGILENVTARSRKKSAEGLSNVAPDTPYADSPYHSLVGGVPSRISA